MSTLWLVDRPEIEDERITKIVFDVSELSDYSHIGNLLDEIVEITDDRVEKVEVNAAKLYEALTRAIELGWFKPNQSTLSTMADILRKEGYDVS
jgi:hypothetical protein